MSPNNTKNRLKSILTNPLGCSNCSRTQPNSDVHSPQPKPKPKPKPTAHPQPKADSTSSSTTSTSDSKTSTSLSTAECCSDEPGPSWPDNDHHHHKAAAIDKTEMSTSTTTAAEDAVAACSGRIEESVAVVTETEDPYGEFRRSMLQMIFEKEIFSPEDLQHLLRCFLRLNSSAHHDVILRAFFDVCNDVASTSPPPPSSPASKPKPEHEPEAGPDGNGVGDDNHHDHDPVSRV